MPTASLALARAAGHLSRRLGRGGGTSLPGKILLRMRPEALAELGSELPRGRRPDLGDQRQDHHARLVASCAREAGWELIANPSGANLLSGVATALLDARAPHAHPPQAGLFEVDEAALSEVARQLPPRVLVLMNLFRDQLDRLRGARAARRPLGVAGGGACRPASTPVLNADDPADRRAGRRARRRR